MNKRVIWTLSGIVVGVCISLTLTLSYGAMQGFRTPSERKEYVEKRNKGITLKQLAERVTKLEIDVKQLMKGITK